MPSDSTPQTTIDGGAKPPAPPHPNPPNPSNPNHNVYAFLVGNPCDGTDDVDTSRDDVGDGAFRLALSNAGIPPSQMAWIYRVEHCTRTYVRTQLLKFLRRIRSAPPSMTKDATLIFYYTGHGQVDEFCTNGEEDGHWPHRAVVDIIEDEFVGSKVWLMADCCYAGTLYRAVKGRRRDDRRDNKKLRLSYGVVMSTGIDTLARGHWTATETWINAVRKGLTVRDAMEFGGDGTARIKRDRMTYWSSSTTTGEGGIDIDGPFLGVCGGDGAAVAAETTPLATAAAMEQIEGRGTVKDEEEAGSVVGRPMLRGGIRNLSLSTGDKEEEEEEEGKKGKPEEFYQCKDDPLRFGLTPPLCSWAGLPSPPAVGDEVYARWKGGRPSSSAAVVVGGKKKKTNRTDDADTIMPYVMPLWFPAKVTALTPPHGNGDDNGNGDSDGEGEGSTTTTNLTQSESESAAAAALVTVQMSDPTTPTLRWTALVNVHTHLLPATYFDNHHTWSEDCMAAQRCMAAKLRYYDYTMQVGTRVRVLWNDDYGMRISGGRVMAQDDYNDEHRGVDWEGVEEMDGLTGIEEYDGIVAGGFVWVEWDEDGESASLVPVSRCVVVVEEEEDDDDGRGGAEGMMALGHQIKDKAESDEAKAEIEIKTPVDAVLHSLRSAGKTLGTVESVLSDWKEGDVLYGYCEVEGYWYLCRPLAVPSELTVEALSGHVCHEHGGEYCPVLCLEDGTASVLPKQFLRRCPPPSPQNSTDEGQDGGVGEQPPQTLSFFKWGKGGTTTVRVEADKCAPPWTTTRKQCLRGGG